MNGFRTVLQIIIPPLIMVMVVLGFWPARSVWAAPPTRPLYATCVVTTPADSGPGSLRQCMLNAASGDTIVFDPAVFPESSPITITLITALPGITQGHLTIDGSGAGVILDGSACPEPWDNGFFITSSNNLIKGLQIFYFPASGVRIQDGARYNTISNNVISKNTHWGVDIEGTGTMSNTVVGNLIGTDPSGMVAMGNEWAGVWIQLGTQYNVIGGDTPAERNIISGNQGGGIDIRDNGTDYNKVIGNYIGTDINGLTAISNTHGAGVAINNGARYNTIGGNTPGERNIISGNDNHGLAIINAHHNTVSGNFIGTDVNGTAAIGNNTAIRIWQSSRYNTIGGLTIGERNIISGNSGEGVSVDGSGTMSNTIIGNYIGTDVYGAATLGNSGSGVVISDNARRNIVGGDTPQERNLISGNAGAGVMVFGSCHYNVISGNYVGTDVNGLAAIPNSRGINIGDGSKYNIVGGTTPGERNVVSGNTDPEYSAGVWLDGVGTEHNVIIGNYVGTDARGTAALGNGNSPSGGPGVTIQNGASQNTIGGDTPQERNLISGNNGSGIQILFGPGYNTVSGNYIGTDINGTAALANNGCGIQIGHGSSNNIVGGENGSPGEACTGECNLISGNRADGVCLDADSGSTEYNLISGNYIGVNVNGIVPIPNGYNGINIRTAANYTTIGGNTPATRNLISGNGGIGVNIVDSHHTSVKGNYIGLDVSGNNDLGNTSDGVYLGGEATGNTIGGAAAGEGNVISANGYGGVSIWNSNTMSNTVMGNFIGTNAGGTIALGNGAGIRIHDGAQYNVIGGDTPAERNLISGNDADGIDLNNSHYNTVSGNYIGTNMAGTSAIPNGESGVGVCCGAGRNTIGGDTPQERNLISGNTGAGVMVFGNCHYNVISGNYVGTDVNGLAAVPNRSRGIGISDGSKYNIVGGTTPGERNVVSGNTSTPSEYTPGVWLSGAGTEFNVVSGNYIGTDASGTIALGNGNPPFGGPGVSISNDASQNTVGGDTPQERNLISGNNGGGIQILFGPGYNTISGNYIGTDYTGLIALPNQGYGVQVGQGSNNNVIGGNNASPGGDCTGECNLISGNDSTGVTLEDTGTDYNTVSGNYIGTNISGTTTIPNNGDGVYIFEEASYNTIGGDTPARRNLISGNMQHGVCIGDGNSNHNTIIGNYIGTDVSGTNGLGNENSGVVVWGSAQFNMIGGNTSKEQNSIAFNTRSGVEVRDNNTFYSTITRNSIHSNGELGIDLVDGGNTELSAPTIITYNQVAGTISGTACANCTVEIFSDDGDEGGAYEGSATADAGGNWAFDKSSVLVGPNLTATATDPQGNTSEFSIPAVGELLVRNYVYLPIVLKPSPLIYIYVKSINTGGVNPVEIRDPHNGHELLLSCSVGNNVTQLCGTFPAVGTYSVTAYTANCGQLGPVQFNDASIPGSQITRTVLCQ